MQYQDQVIKTTIKSLEDIVRAAQAVPDDKADWVPDIGNCRSVLAQMREVAATPGMFVEFLTTGVSMTDHEGHPYSHLESIAQCVTAARTETNRFVDTVSQIPNSRLDEELQLPFGGMSLVTLADVMLLPSWNMIYHLGQISQIQLMLGDGKMH